MIDRTYYIYLHRRSDSGEVFYVGKGTRTRKHQYARASDSASRNIHWRRIVEKYGYSIEVIADFFTEADAFDFERQLIVVHGRVCDGGTLCNLTAGGDGHSGYTPTDATREKLRILVSGDRHPNYGKKLSAETCLKKSESMKSSMHNLRGKRLPDWWRAKIAAAKIGTRNPMYGKTGSQHPNSRKVRDGESGIVYDSVQIAADTLGLKTKTLYNWLSGHRPNPTTLEFA